MNRLAWSAISALALGACNVARSAPSRAEALAVTAFSAAPATIAAGGSTTLSWSVTGATSVAIDHGVGDVTEVRAKVVSPSATTTYTLTASAGASAVNGTATVTVTGGGGPPPPPPPPDATISVDTSQSRRAISRFVYGYNSDNAASAPPGTTWLRVGGNRWTAYNWTSNYSNAGSDYGPYESDTLMGSPSDGPGRAAVVAVNDAKLHGLGLLVTIPIQGWAAKDANGNVSLTDPVSNRFAQNQARKGSAFTATPSSSSDPVFQDEFAWFVSGKWGTGATPIQFSLDNEPDLWASTHAEIQRTALTYSALLSQSLAAAAAIKDAVPSALLFGPVSFGWSGYVNLQNAADASQHGDFLDYYLDQMSSASSSQGRRLLDVLDLHFYSEARGCGARVNDNSSGNGDCVRAARVQATRSYWDASYKESSWITGCCTSGGGIRLIGRMFDKIAAHDPGTMLAITEYNGGGSDDISGAVAQADTLGIFGREGVFASSYWALQSDNSWAFAAWRAFRGYDGAGHNFGDTSVLAGTSDVQHVAAYASVDSAAPDRVVIVLVHRPGAVVDGSGAVIGSDGSQSRVVKVQVAHPRALTSARAWQLAGGAAPVWQSSFPAVSSNAVTVTLPPLSVTTIELTP